MKAGYLRFLILFGKSGSGKSEILRCLKDRGEQVLDLEGMALHNGSVFGGMGDDQQPTQEEFETGIKSILYNYSSDRPVWVEFESNYLGRLHIPVWLIREMEQGEMIVVYAPLEQRIKRIVSIYSKIPNDELLNALSKIKKKFNHRKYLMIKRSIEEHDYGTAASFLLTYYDRIYENALKRSPMPILVQMKISGSSAKDDANKIYEEIYSGSLGSKQELRTEVRPD